MSSRCRGPARILLEKLIRRVLRGEFFVIFGRFYWFRRAYRFTKRRSQRQDPLTGRLLPLNLDLGLFKDLSSRTCVNRLKETGVYCGLSLPKSVIQEIYDFAVAADCSRPGYDERFLIGQIENGRLANGNPVVQADVRDVSACPVIEAISHHPKLLAVARGFMGYTPNRVATRLFWSLVCSHSDELRRRLHQPIDFHYDVDGYNTLNTYFYLTDTNEKRGAHVVIEGSHKRKPMSLKLWTRFHPDDVILKIYGESAPKVIKGSRGFGFIVDPACFHKILPPVDERRLMLQIRFDSLDRRLERTYLETNR